MDAPAIRLHQLAFRWRGNGAFRPTADDAFCLTVDDIALGAGSSLFLHGPSGSGKSTLLNLIGGVLLPERGTIDLLGQDMCRLAPGQRDAFRADHMGFIFQQFNLVPYLSALDNVLLPCRFSARRAARAGDARAAAHRLCAALDLDPALLARNAAALSVGQQQRVAAARALIGQPEILIADEPTSALDADRQTRFVELLLAEARQTRSAVVFVSHDLRLAQYFDTRLPLGAAAPST
jgi:putative ABC transport system ATP-binding protein